MCPVPSCTFEEKCINIFSRHLNRHSLDHPGVKFPCFKCRVLLKGGRNWKRHVLSNACSARYPYVAEHPQQSLSECNEADCSNSDPQCDDPVPAVVSECDSRTEVALFLRKLQFHHNVSASVASFVAENVCGLLEKAIVEAGSQEAHESVDNVSSRSKTLQACKDFTFSYSLNKFIRDEFPDVQPVNVIVGRSPQGKTYCYQYIPLLQQLRAILLSNDHITSYVLKGTKPSCHVLKDIHDGTCHRHDDARLIRLVFYFGEFGVVDPSETKF